jgi:hypothetical protein
MRFWVLVSVAACTGADDRIDFVGGWVFAPESVSVTVCGGEGGMEPDQLEEGVVEVIATGEMLELSPFVHRETYGWPPRGCPAFRLVANGRVATLVEPRQCILSVVPTIVDFDRLTIRIDELDQLIFEGFATRSFPDPPTCVDRLIARATRR